MNLTHTWAIFAGLLAVGLPLVVHWMTKPRPKRMAMSTVRFINEIVKQRRSTHRLRDLIVLLTRAMAIALLAFAFGRPKGDQRQLVTPGAQGKTLRIVMLDQSQSMAARSQGTSSFEKARAAAGKFLEYQADMQADLLLCGAECRAVFDRPSANFAALREQLSGAKVLPHRLNAQAAINAAAEVLQKSSAANTRRELVIASDFQRSNWVSVDYSALPADTVISFQSCAAETAGPNLAVTAIRSHGRAQEGRTLRAEVEVGNFSPAGREVQLEVTIGSRVQQVKGFCPPGARTAIPLKLEFAQAGWYWGEARILQANDVLPADDTRAWVLHVQRSPAYLLVTRQAPRPHLASSHYLERALVPHLVEAQAPGERVTRVDTVNLDLEKLTGADVIVLDHPGTLSQEQVDLLSGIMRRGKGVFYMACESADAVNLKRLAGSAGNDLRMPVEFAPAPTGAPRREIFWSDYRVDVPPFSTYGQSLNAAAAELRFTNCLVSRRLESGLESDILVTYSDRSAAVVQAPCGPGMLAVVNVDLLRCNLPHSPLFAAMVAEIANKLVQRRPAADVECGEAATLWLPQEQTQANALRLVGPKADSPCGSLIAQSQQVSWRMRPVPSPGVYRVLRSNDEVVFAAAVGISDQESDLLTLEPEVLTTRLASGRTVEFRDSQQHSEQSESWPWILVACLVLLLGEWAALRAFKS